MKINRPMKFIGTALAIFLKQAIAIPIAKTVPILDQRSHLVDCMKSYIGGTKIVMRTNPKVIAS